MWQYLYGFTLGLGLFVIIAIAACIMINLWSD